MAVSNLASKMKLSYDDICNMILIEELLRKDSREFFGMSMVVSIDDWGLALDIKV